MNSIVKPFQAIFSAKSLVVNQVRFCARITKPLSKTHSFNKYQAYVREYLPNPSDLKRLRRHGWICRWRSPGGREVIMRRMLKGRFYLSH